MDLPNSRSHIDFYCRNDLRDRKKTWNSLTFSNYLYSTSFKWNKTKHIFVPKTNQILLQANYWNKTFQYSSTPECDTIAFYFLLLNVTATLSFQFMLTFNFMSFSIYFIVVTAFLCLLFFSHKYCGILDIYQQQLKISTEKQIENQCVIFFLTQSNKQQICFI